MRIKSDQPVRASIDDGLTVTTWEPGENEVPDWVGEMAIIHCGAVNLDEPIKADDNKKQKA